MALACVPAVVVALIGAWGVVANPTGGWVWPPDDVNVSEAVATRNYAELVRLLENGADPTRPNLVRGSLLTSRLSLVWSALARVSEKVVSRTLALAFERARNTARCRATIVFPVPAEPDTLAGPV